MEDQIIWQGKSSQIINLKQFTINGIAILFLLGVSRSWGTVAYIGMVFFAFRLAYYFLLVHLATYTLTNERLIIEMGVFRRETRDIELYKVRDVALTEPLFQAFFKVGTLTIISYQALTSEFQLVAVPNPKQLREMIRKSAGSARVSGTMLG